MNTYPLRNSSRTPIEWHIIRTGSRKENPPKNWFETVEAALLFSAFCVSITIGAIHAAALFANTSYKLVIFFLAIIAAANVGGKYIIWCLEH